MEGKRGDGLNTMKNSTTIMHVICRTRYPTNRKERTLKRLVSGHIH